MQDPAMTQIVDVGAHAPDAPVIRKLGADRPVVWLAAGWRDLMAHPLPSLSHGVLMALAGWLILHAVASNPHLFSLAVSGFFLVAPLLSAGLYEISRRHERGESCSFLDSLAGWRRNGDAVALFGIGLALAVVAWERSSALVFELIDAGGGDFGAGVSNFMQAVVLSGNHIGVVVAWFIFGAILAGIVFALAAVSVPMMVDRSGEPAGGLMTATYTSLRAVMINLDAMFLWALMLVALTAIGFATYLLGLVLIIPWLGHATWHAYRDLVEAPTRP
jgi:uncharacterized membrane protein